jgi:hypothetical protein
MTPIAIESTRGHVERLCLEHGINCFTIQRGGYALHEIREIHLPPIRSPVTYAVALHEVGHCLGRHQQSKHLMIREGWAWRWARSHALCWTPAMERKARKSLEWYEPRAAKMDRELAQQATIIEQLEAWAHSRAEF